MAKEKTLKELGIPQNHDERMKYMNGCEIRSGLFDGLVMVDDGKIYQDGYVLLDRSKSEISPRTSLILMDEMCANELGGDAGYYGYTRNQEKYWWDDHVAKVYRITSENINKQDKEHFLGKENTR